jgi:hypothetical protein
MFEVDEVLLLQAAAFSVVVVGAFLVKKLVSLISRSILL